MANEVYQQLEGNKPQFNFQSFMQNPFGYLIQRNADIPQEYQRDPHSAVQYLLNSGQMNQQSFNKVFNQLQRMGIRFS